MTKQLLRSVRVLCASVALVAAGCGGGGGGDSPEPSPTQGLWQGTWTTTSGELKASAAVLPDGQAWVVGTDTNASPRLLKIKFSAQGTGFAGTGRQHMPGVTSSTTATASATVTARSTLQGTFTVGGVGQSFAMTYDSRYDTAAVIADFAGEWTGLLAGGAVEATWNITDKGVVTGTSTTGCSYSGRLQTRSEAKAIVDAVVNETCAGTTTLLSGVATLNAEKSRLSVTTTTPGETAAVLLSLQR